MADKGPVKMVVVNGVRYRPEDAPERKSEVQNKARQTSSGSK